MLDLTNPPAAPLTMFLGGTTCAFITLGMVRDVTAILVGMTTIVCLIYTNFVLPNKRKKDHSK